MSRFVFFVIYVGVLLALDTYVFFVLRRGFHWKRFGIVTFWVVAAGMVLMPIVSRRFDSAGCFGWAAATALTGYAWLLALLWYGCGGLVLDVWNLAVRGVARFLSGKHVAAVRWPTAVRILSGLLAVATVVGSGEAERIHLREIEFSSAKIPSGIPPVRIVQISDVHLGVILRERHLRRIIKLVREAEPDLLVSTGDLLDSSASHMEELMSMLREIRVPGGKFAVLGNHEYFCGVEGALRLLSVAGFRVLRGENVEVEVRGIKLRVAGVDDPVGRMMRAEAITDEDRVLRVNGKGAFVILLKHQPSVRASSLGSFDLQLSGHTHGGQVAPFQAIVAAVYGRLRGLHRLPSNGWLYVSTGAGTWGPPIRLGARPEATLIKLRGIGEKVGAALEREVPDRGQSRCLRECD